MVVLAMLMDVGWSKRDGPANTHTRQPRDNNLRQTPQVVILFFFAADPFRPQSRRPVQTMDGTLFVVWCCPLLTRVCGR